MLNFKQFPFPQSASVVFSAYASIATTTMLARSIANELIPQQNANLLFSKKQKKFKCKSTYPYSCGPSLDIIINTPSPFIHSIHSQFHYRRRQRRSSPFNVMNFKEFAFPPSASAVFSAYASIATTIMLLRSMANEPIPKQLLSFFSSTFFYIFGSAFSQTKFIIEEQSSFIPNEIFQAAEIYLHTKITPSTDVIKINKTPRDKKLTLSITNDQEIADQFDKIPLQWRLISTKDESRQNGEKRQFELKFPKKFRDRVVDFYLPHVLKRAEEIKEEDKIVKISSEDRYPYGQGDESGTINLDHPATFDTLAMDPELKQWIIDDLDRFVRRRDFYRKVGKAWKRGYLLYGPPGTGKSSLIAAMANYLKFDVYDLDLSNIHRNFDLRRVMLTTKNRSILVIEDIDCSADIQNRETGVYGDNSKFTLSGMLNFIDGLWSSCGDERIIIFTTNHKDRLDPALLRPGRMDVHIHMSYLSPQGFKVLGTNYIGGKVTEHPLYGEIEKMIGEMELSPAEIAEELMKSEDVNAVMEGLVEFLKGKREEQRKGKEEEILEEGSEK